MQRILIVDVEKCTGCRMCEVICSFHHERKIAPAKSRIHVLSWEREGLFIPMMCLHCDTPICLRICPVQAIYKDPQTGGVLVNSDVCIGCKMCVISCPFGGISMDMDTRKIIKCDLCLGNPKCAEICPTGAISYATVTKATLSRKRESVRRIEELVKKLAIYPTQT